MIRLSWWWVVDTHRLYDDEGWLEYSFDVEKNSYLVVAEITFLWWRRTVIRKSMMAYMQEGLASRLSADSDLSRLEVENFT
jgi:hypothetical protein